MINLLSNDVNRFEFLCTFMHPIWVAPIMTIIATYILWMEVRWAGIIGVAVIFIIVPIQSKSTQKSIYLAYSIREKDFFQQAEATRQMNVIAQITFEELKFSRLFGRGLCEKIISDL